jgi:hypothetical protein
VETILPGLQAPCPGCKVAIRNLQTLNDLWQKEPDCLCPDCYDALVSCLLLYYTPDVDMWTEASPSPKRTAD